MMGHVEEGAFNSILTKMQSFSEPVSWGCGLHKYVCPSSRGITCSPPCLLHSSLAIVFSMYFLKTLFLLSLIFYFVLNDFLLFLLFVCLFAFSLGDTRKLKLGWNSLPLPMVSFQNCPLANSFPLETRLCREKSLSKFPWWLWHPSSSSQPGGHFSQRLTGITQGGSWSQSLNECGTHLWL